MDETVPSERMHPEALGATLLRLLGLVVLALLFWRLAGVLLLGFAALLLATTFVALADALRRIAPIPRRAAVALSCLILLGGVAAIVGFYGWRIAGQYREIFAKAQEGARTALAFAQAHDWSRFVLQKASGAQITDATDFLAPLLGSLIGGAGRYLAYGVIIIACGVFLALDPERYRRELLQLVPGAHRPLAETFLNRTGTTLRLWLISRVVVMGAIGVLASAGLLVLHIPAALALGLTGALLTFIPYLGPLLAAAPAVLVAFTISPLQALLTGLMFWGVHFIEGTFITPVVQDKQVQLSPVLTILGTLAFGASLGPSGFVLASPLILVLLVAGRVFYVERRGEPLAQEGDPEAGEAPVAAVTPAGQRPRLARPAALEPGLGG